MKKAIVSVGYHQFVMDTSNALAFLELLADAEMYEEKWHATADGGTTHHVYPQDTRDSVRQLQVVPTAFYHMAKMAGRPEKES